MRALKPYPLKKAFLGEELSNVIPSLDVTLQGGLSAVFDVLLEIVGDAIGVDFAQIVLGQCRASPSSLMVAQPLAGHKAVHTIAAVIW